MAEKKPTLDYAGSSRGITDPRPKRSFILRPNFRGDAAALLIGISLVYYGITPFFQGQGSAESGALVIVGVLIAFAGIRGFRPVRPVKGNSDGSPPTSTNVPPKD